VDYAIGGNPASMRGNHASMRGNHINVRSAQAPAASMDGQVILFLDDSLVDLDKFISIQSIANLPDMPAWASVAGKGYRISTSADVPSLSSASISFTYNMDDVAPGEEAWLRLYHWTGTDWLELDTTLDTYTNTASGLVQGEGLYALMSSFKIPLRGPGWNNVAYPLQVTLPVEKALTSVSGSYTQVYHYDALTGAWQVYVPGAPAWVSDLDEMQFGQGYWVQATQNVNWKISGSSSSSSRSGALYPLFPALLYGEVGTQGQASLAPGDRLDAMIGSTHCGSALLKRVQGKLVYVIKVLADDQDQYSGCGATGRKITLQIGDTSLGSLAWDDSQAQVSNLVYGWLKLFLPFMSKNR
jgi:hypothetical protein